ncbi:two-component regulator propeller domain-containing protein [Alistipes ihumii]|uniref:two-component regulator propeller domain-containing protein n=1 Tax=Alistipes ihumii TaxID=1470347 RepID=UPI003AB6CBFC
MNCVSERNLKDVVYLLLLQNYQYDNKNPQTISHNPVNAIYEDHSGNLWTTSSATEFLNLLTNTDLLS